MAALTGKSHQLFVKSILQSYYNIMQVQTIVIFVSLAGVWTAGQEQSQYTNGVTKPAYEQQAPMPHSFAWTVKDESSNDYAHQQESDGKVTTGSYRVVLPDGRTQIVAYRADENGYVADVKYDGEARYPEYKPSTYNKPAAYPIPTEAAKPEYSSA